MLYLFPRTLAATRNLNVSTSSTSLLIFLLTPNERRDCGFSSSRPWNNGNIDVSYVSQAYHYGEHFSKWNLVGLLSDIAQN